MKPGNIVQMSKQLKERLREAGSGDHVDEFGDRIGIVLEPVDYGSGRLGPEVNVSWEPSGLRYAYDPTDLVIFNVFKDD